MGFTESYVRSLNASDLRDDERHHATDALHASALAEKELEDSAVNRDMFGSLLARVKYGSGTIRQEFEGNHQNLAQLVRIWAMLVAQKGKARKWVTVKAAWDIPMAHALYHRVAEQSLTHWLDDRCQPCKGAGKDISQHDCPRCEGTGKATLPETFEGNLAKDMASELEEVVISYSQRAAYLLRKSA